MGIGGIRQDISCIVRFECKNHNRAYAFNVVSQPLKVTSFSEVGSCVIKLDYNLYIFLYDFLMILSLSFT